jgi:uncharacterized sporulation protein YeaH/YhbH (DUF444 family)
MELLGVVVPHAIQQEHSFALVDQFQSAHISNKEDVMKAFS